MLDAFLQRVSEKDCPNCPRMKDCQPVLRMKESDLNKPIMFIAEAPDRLGAEISRIPLYGDQTGDNFEELLAQTGLTRRQCYITNAVLCVPLHKGKNDTPKESEIRNCSSFLFDQIKLIQPRLIVTLGRSALLALRKIKKHEMRLPGPFEGPTVQEWNGYKVLPLYHPGPRVMNIYRNKEQQIADYRVIREWLSYK